MLTKVDIDWLKESFLPDLADAVAEKLKNRLDAIKTTLDGFAGDVKDKREAQEFHQHNHDKIDERLTTIEKRLRIPLPQN